MYRLILSTIFILFSTLSSASETVVSCFMDEHDVAGTRHVYTILNDNNAYTMEYQRLFTDPNGNVQIDEEYTIPAYESAMPKGRDVIHLFDMNTNYLEVTLLQSENNFLIGALKNFDDSIDTPLECED